jgi:putative ABC transport system permease protein
LLCEFTLVGAIAGVVAAAGALAVGWVVASQVLDVPGRLTMQPVLWALLLGIGMALAGAVWLLRAVLGTPPGPHLRHTP